MTTLCIQPAHDGVCRVRCELPTGFDAKNESDFFDFCQQNRDLKIERSASGEIEIMAPTGFETGCRNADIVAQLFHWAKTDGRGVVSDSSTGYLLPNGAERAPDASWTLRARVESVPTETRRKFLPLCPDFVIELRSPTDNLEKLRLKLEEYVANGAALGWLIDPIEKKVHLYRPNSPPEILDHPVQLTGSDPIESFVLNLNDIFA